MVCPTCKKTFKDSSNFSNHKKIHNRGYIPRKRKRVGIMRNGGSSDTAEMASEGTSVSAEMNIASEQVATETTISQMEGLEAQKSIQLAGSGAENALKDFATISMATEGLQIAGQELFRQIFGTAFDPADLRHLANAQSTAGSTNNVFNLSPIDVRSLQMIINGAQARNPAPSASSGATTVSEHK